MSCGGCASRRKDAQRTAGPMPPRKEWRVFMPKGNTRDYYTEADADQAIAKHGDPEKENMGCRKIRLSR